ncbi:pogo transposable element with KRAB domain [Rhizophagus clarus]|uniref:Pogo transposable element with KRAB domain n=1 Tax=Rhizophagus clarus TaxID=94130 RepID=A0A8H3M2L0_9GLOM|nr:pogo transposable element with KRAB domain [Rhizophagus clarus]
MDETPIWFDMAGNMTINNKGDKTVYICTTDGSKYPSICIFKGKQLPREEVIPKGGHLEESVKNKFKQHDFHLAVIPAGLTSICQPLDVSINKPFKDIMRKEWHEWICQGGAGETEAGNLKRARISDVCGWIKRSWDAISNQIIFNSFKKCAISNMLDGSEDDMVYEEIDKLIAEIKEENSDKLDDSTEIVDN